MGVNLVPIVRDFRISREEFTEGSQDHHSVEDGCVTLGVHKLLRFDFLCHNIGDTDLEVGSPLSRPDLFVLSNSHGHYHLKDFIYMVLTDNSGRIVVKGQKESFCLEDSEPLSPWAKPQPRFSDCDNNQGISSGWADLYPWWLPCQFFVLEDENGNPIPDGDYILEVTTNYNHIFEEDNYEDNTIKVYLNIQGDNVLPRSPAQSIVK